MGKGKKKDLTEPKAMASGVKVYCAHDSIEDITKLIPNPRNPNKHPRNQIELLAKIIMNAGWRGPVTVSTRSGFIVRGHGRYEAAKIMQVEQIPVDFQNYASEAEEWADLIADNRIAELSRMDTTGLKELLLEIDTGAFDMDLTGFDMGSLEDLMTLGMPPANDAEEEWEGMPDFEQEDAAPMRTLSVHFMDEEGIVDFQKLIGQEFSEKAKYIYHPEQEIDHVADSRWVGEGEESEGEEEEATEETETDEG